MRVNIKDREWIGGAEEIATADTKQTFSCTQEIERKIRKKSLKLSQWLFRLNNIPMTFLNKQISGYSLKFL